MQLDKRVQYLIAIGASICANCQSCLQSSIALALQVGVSEREVDEAMGVGRQVRRCAAKRENRADSLAEESPSVENVSAVCCGAGEIENWEERSK